LSRAFVSEQAAEADAARLPERLVSAAPNLVTPRGLALIEAAISRLQDRLAAAEPDDPARAAAERDLRYWRARRASATVMPAISGTPDEVAFGCRVTVRRAGAAALSYTIVGEDEADPPAGLLSYTSPLATALMGARVGDVVDIGGGRPAVTVERLMAG
jgi:transcription elongation GreA/GreB family factor